MLAEAKRKNVYRALIECDITKPKKWPFESYDGVISCGTFTLGHLGPQFLKRIIDMLVEGGLGVIGINKEHFSNEGFESAILEMETQKQIKKVSF